MQREIKIPQERPNPNKIDKEKEKKKKLGNKNYEIMKVLNGSEEEKEKESERKYLPRIDANIEEKTTTIVVSLWWKKSYKAVTNWMRKHMEAYSITHNGFIVRFIDDDERKGYKVEPCSDRIKGEKINWVNYKITQIVVPEKIIELVSWKIKEILEYE